MRETRGETRFIEFTFVCSTLPKLNSDTQDLFHWICISKMLSLRLAVLDRSISIKTCLH
jgi:hypothetical protein